MNFYIKKCKKYNRINDINIDREETIVRSVNIVSTSAYIKINHSDF